MVQFSIDTLRIYVDDFYLFRAKYAPFSLLFYTGLSTRHSCVSCVLAVARSGGFLHKSPPRRGGTTVLAVSIPIDVEGERWKEEGVKRPGR